MEITSAAFTFGLLMICGAVNSVSWKNFLDDAAKTNEVCLQGLNDLGKKAIACHANGTKERMISKCEKCFEENSKSSMCQLATQKRASGSGNTKKRPKREDDSFIGNMTKLYDCFHTSLNQSLNRNKCSNVTADLLLDWLGECASKDPEIFDMHRKFLNCMTKTKAIGGINNGEDNEIDNGEVQSEKNVDEDDFHNMGTVDSDPNYSIGDHGAPDEHDGGDPADMEGDDDGVEGDDNDDSVGEKGNDGSVVEEGHDGSFEGEGNDGSFEEEGDDGSIEEDGDKDGIEEEDHDDGIEEEDDEDSAEDNDDDGDDEDPEKDMDEED